MVEGRYLQVPWDQVTGNRGGGCKKQVPLGLDCFSHKVVNLSIMIGISRDR